MSKQTWKNFCIVGAGNHVMKKLIPALEKENKSILGLITSKKKT